MDRLVHLHELQHALLTSTTAWGGAILVTSRIPGWEALFGQLLDRCRTTHESFATYMSCSVVAAGFGSPAAALASYPEYVPLVNRLEQYLAPIPGDHRRSLAATALARVCMQTPVLEQMIASWPTAITAGTLHATDVPDERLNTLLREEAGLPAALAATADDTVAAEFGPEALAADGPAPSASLALDDRFDPAWARWEDTLFAGLAAQLTAGGACVPGSQDHLHAAADLVALARSAVPGLGVTIGPEPEVLDDTRMIAHILHQSRLWLSAAPRPARLITLGEDVELAEVVRVADATTRLAGRPNLVLSARLPGRLLAGYDLSGREHAVLADLGAPVLVTRTIADDGTGTESDAVWLVRLSEPADVARLASAWNGRGDLTCCVAASCLADTQWRREWLPHLEQTGPVVWLIDVTIRSLADVFGAGRTVHGIYLDLSLNPTGARKAVAFKVSGAAGIWLAVGDDVGIQMITQQVADLPGIDLRMTGADWTAVIPELRLALHDLLRSESYVDLRGLTEHQH